MASPGPLCQRLARQRIRTPARPFVWSSGPRYHYSQDAEQQGPSSSPSSASSSSSSTSTSSSPSSTNAARRRFSEQLSPHVQRLSSSLATQRALYEPKIRQSLSNLGEKWNLYSGYHEIEVAKQKVVEAEEELEILRRDVQSQAKGRYMEAVRIRSQSQKTINDLLSRKSSWSDSDLLQYTSLLRSEHSESRDEDLAREEFEKVEREVGRAWDQVVKKTLERYHDEQVWSDRVRNISSYTQLAVVGLNVFIFALAILLVEPYKRRKLAETFETRLLKGEKQGRLALEAVMERFDGNVQALSKGLQELQVGQQGLLAVAGVAGKERSSSTSRIEAEEAERIPSSSPLDEGRARSSSSSETAIIEEARPSLAQDPLLASQLLLLQLRRRTEFLIDAKTEQEEQRRNEVATATGIGALMGGLICGWLMRR